MLLGDVIQVCGKTADILRLVGWFVTVFKIVIPLIIIVLGLVDLGKAAVSSKPEEIKKSATSLVWRLVGGIAIFFIPSLIMFVVGFIGNGWTAAENHTDFDTCYACIVSPWSDNCVQLSPTDPTIK